MMATESYEMDARFDLELRRDVALSPELIWRAWTTPDLLMQWFTPAPWRTTACEIDLRPGGRFDTTMRGPDGEEGGGSGCYLVVEENRRLVWTAALGPGFRPQTSDLPFTAVIELDPTDDGGTRFRAVAIHETEDQASLHREMGFEEGWGAAFDQLVALMGGPDRP